MSNKVIIVGGVAGGASAAARLRRLDETAEKLTWFLRFLCYTIMTTVTLLTHN